MTRQEKSTRLYWIGFLTIISCVLTTFIVAKLTMSSKEFANTPESEIASKPVATLSPSENSNLPYDRITAPPIESIQEQKIRLEKFTIHVGTYASKREAEQKILELNRANISAFYTPVRLNTRVLFHVRTGVFSSVKDAQTMQSRLASRNITTSVTKLQ